MDKPLSQERLSLADLHNHLGHLVMELSEEGYRRLQIIGAEVKRLQAIEAERDRYKAAFDYSVTNLAAYGLKQTSAQAMKMLEGVSDHE